jgi:glycosyltransferase involved in cell wall biosynthesis
MNKRIIFIHSLNNYTGSPNILSLIIRGFVNKGYKTDLITNRSVGFLSNIENIRYRYTSYKWHQNKVLTLSLLVWSEIEMFFIILLHYRKENAIFYINTIIPFGAAWACKLLNKKRVYHVHENMFLSKPLYWFYRFTYKSCNQKSVFVSKYLQEITGIDKNSVVIYNSLSPEFIEKVKSQNLNERQNLNNILMIGSLRNFKGVYEFVAISKHLPQYNFIIVVSASETEVENFKKKSNPPVNLFLYPLQTNLHPFYDQAKILLNLTHPDKWIETFGLTILEAMVYGIPAIVPNAGGPTELVENGVNGFTIDPLNISLLKDKIKILMEDENLYSHFSSAAIEKSKQFDFEDMITKLENFLSE